MRLVPLAEEVRTQTRIEGRTREDRKTLTSLSQAEALEETSTKLICRRHKWWRICLPTQGMQEKRV